MLGDARFIRTLQLRNLLSFGPDTPPIELGPLNVLDWAERVGQIQHVIEAIDLLRASAYRFDCACARWRGHGGVAVERVLKSALPDAQM